METILLEKSHPLFTYFVNRPKKLKFDTTPDNTYVKLIWTEDASEQRRLNYVVKRKERYRALHPKKVKSDLSQYEKEKLGLVNKRKKREIASDLFPDGKVVIDPLPPIVV
jgi:hypothetical protein